MLEIHLAGKNTKKRQKFDSSTPSSHAYHHHFTLNGEIKKAPGHRQMPVPRWLGKMWTTR
jgi:hypothetical protein